MNKSIFFSLITFCALLVSSCTDDYKKNVDTLGNPIEWRDDCSQCPNGADCCCALEWINIPFGASATICICGATDGLSGPCPAPSGCIGAVASLTMKQVTLNAGNPRVPFCVNQLQGFWVANLRPSTVTFNISCRMDDTDPGWEPYTLAMGERINFEHDGDCNIELCP